MHRIDRSWDNAKHGELVRLADDALVMCDCREQAKAALAEKGGPKSGFGFLGFHHRLVRARGRTGATRVVFLARWPAHKATQHARDRIREITARSRPRAPPFGIIARKVDTFLRCWAEFFRYGNSAHTFDMIQAYTLGRLALFMARRHKSSRRWGWSFIVFGSRTISA